MATFHQQGRFYESEYPEVEDTVIVQVKKLDDKIGAYVSLLEYNNKEGFITISEISKRRIRSMIKVLRVGSSEVCQVVSVDVEKGYINLSKKRVATEDIAPKQEMFAKVKNIHGVMQHVASSNDIDIEDLCAKVSWPLHLKYGTAFDAFKKHVNQELDVWKDCDFSQPGTDLTPIQDKLKKDIETVLVRRLMQAQVRLQAKCEVSCTDYEGIDAVKEALLEGAKASTEEFKVNIKLVAHPLFALSCLCADKDMGMKVLEESLDLIEKAITAKKGTFVLKSKPTFVTTNDDDENKSDKSGSGSDSDSSDEGEQDDTMGNLDADFSDLMKKKLDDDGDDEHDD